MADEVEPYIPSNSAADESEQLRWKLVLKLNEVSRSLQKWHTALSRATGTTAADILRGQGRVLAVIDSVGEISQRDLCAKLGVRPQSLGEVVTKLERQGYIERHTSEEDRRVQMIDITEAGRECVKSHQPNISFADFTDEEARQLLDYLERIERGLDMDAEAMLASPAPEAAEAAASDDDTALNDD